MKRIRRVRDPKPGELIAEWGVMPHGQTSRAGDLCYAWGEGCRSVDGSLLHWVFSTQHYGPGTYKPDPSFVQELERRGYDLTTFRFSIRKKAE